MSATAVVLLVGEDPVTAAAVRLALQNGANLRVTATPAQGAEFVALRERPQVAIVGAGCGREYVVHLCRAFRASQGLDSVRLMVVCGADELEFKRVAAAAGADGFLTPPVDAADIVALAHAAARWKGFHDERSAALADVEGIRQQADRGFDQLIEMLVNLADMRTAGAAERGRRMADLARRIASRFEIPAHLLPDLELAARLQEIGRVVADMSDASDDGLAPNVEGGRFALSARAMLAPVERFRGAAELVGQIYENWDGTGFPDRLLQGQLPLRSRILRALIDYFEALERDPESSSAVIVEELEQHAGTHYDPVVIAQLKAALEELEEQEGGAARRLRLPIPSLDVGMVLAEDLYTESGIKLASVGSSITPGTLEIIRRRHRTEPILHGACVRRGAA